MEKVCYSCGAPLHGDFKGKAEDYCAYCVDEDGKLKGREEILAGIAHWLGSWQPKIDQQTALKRAEKYMEAMPAWADGE